jgi:FtsZ-interacting cell division protein ZipA
LQIWRPWYLAGMSTILIIVIAVVVIALIALALTAGRRRKHAQLRETVGEHRQEADRHAQRANELEAVAAEARERERQHAQTAAEAEQRLPDRN